METRSHMLVVSFGYSGFFQTLVEDGNVVAEFLPFEVAEIIIFRLFDSQARAKESVGFLKVFISFCYSASNPDPMIRSW